MNNVSSCGFRFDTTYTTLPEQFFTKLKPEPVAAPAVVVINNELAETLGLDFSVLSDQQQAALFSGNQIPEDTIPFSQAYAGHQFGHFTVLGDGRAHVLGEHVTPNNKRVDIQFKGSGRTPYSRRGDGRAVLGPMLREYIVAEAMHYLGIPTTRSLAVVTTGESVLRESLLPGSVLTRVAQSHIRVGTFEFAAQQGQTNLIAAIMDYTINRHYPHLLRNENRAMALMHAVMEKQVDLIVNWMRVGFVHGVMNTDNMTLSGETIDYGPCAFMDAYDPGTVFSSIDHGSRYAFANQPTIAQWNLARLAETLLPLIGDTTEQTVEIATEMINQFPAVFKAKWLRMMCNKLGLMEMQDTDEQLVLDLLKWMHTQEADYTNTFHELSRVDKPSGNMFEQKEFVDWYLRWHKRRTQSATAIHTSVRLMKKNNPAVIPRNHKVEEALAAATEGDLAPFHNLMTVLKSPYGDPKSVSAYQTPPCPTERVYQTFCGT